MANKDYSRSKRTLGDFSQRIEEKGTGGNTEIITALTIQFFGGCGALTISLNGKNLNIEELVNLVDGKICIVRNIPEGSTLNCNYILEREFCSVKFNNVEIVHQYPEGSPVEFDIITTTKDYLLITDIRE